MPYDYTSSLPAYQEQGKDYCRSIVLTAIKKLQPCTDKQIAEFLQWPINRITPRRLELQTNGTVALAKKDTDPESKRLVSFWKIKESNYQPVMF